MIAKMRNFSQQTTCLTCRIDTACLYTALSHGIFYPLYSGCWRSGSPTNTMFMLVVKWVMVKKVGKESTLFSLDSFKKVIQPQIFHMLNNSITNLHPATNNRLCLNCEHYRTSPGKNHLKRLLLVGARLPYNIW